MFELATHGAWPVLTQGYHVDKLGRSPLGDVTYQISKLYESSFREKDFVPMLKRVTPPPVMGPVLTPGASFQQTW